jgi:hypothetical protein
VNSGLPSKAQRNATKEAFKMETAVVQLLTPGRIAALLRQPLYRINYILSTRQHIRPTAKAGNVRLFDRQALARVRHEVNALDARRGQV